MICVCLFIGAMGKSAQAPLHVWLPDSMEGPTPISALIHAATMVTAGIFMVARMSPLFELSDAALSFVMLIGAVTAFSMGLVGIVQNDIKRVIAYSTLSQLGYMTVALGCFGLFCRHFPPDDTRLFQGLAVPGRGLGDYCAASPAGHAFHGWPAETDADHLDYGLDRNTGFDRVSRSCPAFIPRMRSLKRCMRLRRFGSGVAYWAVLSGCADHLVLQFPPAVPDIPRQARVTALMSGAGDHPPDGVLQHTPA